MNSYNNCGRPDDTKNVTSFIEISGEENEKIEKIKETDIPVWKVVRLHLDGSTIEDIIEKYPVLSEEEVKDAVSYYYCHRRRIARHFSNDDEVD